MYRVQQPLLNVILIQCLSEKDDLASLEPGEMLRSNLLQNLQGVNRDPSTHDQVQPPVLAEGRYLQHMIGNRRRVDFVPAEAKTPGEVDSSEDNAVDSGLARGEGGDLLTMVIAGDRLQVEKEVGVQRLVS